MIKEGVLKNPGVEIIFAQHVFPSMETGKAGFRQGMYMASTDELYLTVYGKGGHAAMPKDYNNPILIASKILIELNERFMDPKGEIQNKPFPTVLAFGNYIAQGATNVIPEKVEIQGTFRTMNEEWRKQAHALMIKIAGDIAKKEGGSADFRIEHGYPVLVNNEEVTLQASEAAARYLGKENVEELPIRMTAEDFAFFSQHVPACFYRIGTGNIHKGITSGVHTPTFNIDDDALEVSSGLMAYLAINALL
jgi:amidohydrolase